MGSEPFSTGTEREALAGILDEARDALVRKVSGLSERDARRTPTASALSPLAILKHSAVWERRWFQVIVAGRDLPGEWPDVKDPGHDATFAVGAEETVAGLVAYYREQCTVSREIVAATDLGARCARADLVEENVRWVLLHLIQETARHAGHADILRECIDGTVGQ